MRERREWRADDGDCAVRRRKMVGSLLVGDSGGRVLGSWDDEEDVLFDDGFCDGFPRGEAEEEEGFFIVSS